MTGSENNAELSTKTEIASAHAMPFQPVAYSLSDTGCVRETNEDRVGTLWLNNANGRKLLVLVADGMGGHQAGEVASQAAVDAIKREFSLQNHGCDGQVLEDAFLRAHQIIRNMARGNPKLSNMGTTCTALILADWQAWAAHVGDSRLYLIRNREIYQLSEDHSQCMEMVRLGLLSLEAAKRHQLRNVLLHAMGTKEELKMLVWRAPMTVKPGDVYVLCSDGLYDLVDDTEIRDCALQSAPEAACRTLVQTARSRGGHDNISVAVTAIPQMNDNRTELKETRECEVIS